MVQLIRNPGRAGPVNAAAENVLHDPGGVFVRHKVVLIFLVTPVPVDGTGAHIVSLPPLGLQGSPGLDRDIPTVSVVNNAFDGEYQVIAGVFILRVDVVRHRNEANPKSGKNLTQIAAGLDVFPPKSGQVFDNNAVHCSVFDIGHHFLKGRPVKENSTITVIHPFCH